MKILIVLFCTKAEPWATLITAARQTWDSIAHPNMRTIYLYGEGKKGMEGDCFHAGIKEHYNHQHLKFKKLLDYIWNEEWDAVWTMSTSSYIDKAKLYKKIMSLPKEKCYFGHDASGYVSGAGRYMTRDCCDILRKHLPKSAHASEDTLVGQVLKEHGITYQHEGSERVQYNFDTHKIKRCYHYRCKNDQNRLAEPEAFRRIFNNECF